MNTVAGTPVSTTATLTAGVSPSRRMNVSSPVIRTGAMNRRASDGRSRRISWTTRRNRARRRRGFIGRPPSRRRTGGRPARGRRWRRRPAGPAGAARDDPARPHEQQLVAAIGLVHHVARHDQGDPVRGELAEVGPELDPEQRVDAHRRLVEEQDRRAVDERARQRQPPALATRQRARDRLGSIGQVDELERLDHRRVAIDPVDRGEEPRVLAYGQRRVDPVALGHVPDPAEVGPRRHPDAQHLGVAGRGARHAREQPDQRRLAGPVGAQDPEIWPGASSNHTPSTARNGPKALTRSTARTAGRAAAAASAGRARRCAPLAQLREAATDDSSVDEF